MLNKTSIPFDYLTILGVVFLALYLLGSAINGWLGQTIDQVQKLLLF